MNTMQQEFDAVVTHLFTQGKPAKDIEHDFCAYRGAGGTSCAVGIRIPDSVYKASMEGMQVETLVDLFPDELPAEIYAYTSLFGKLQSLHDNWDFHGHCESMSFNSWLTQELPAIAKDMGLIYNGPMV